MRDEEVRGVYPAFVCDINDPEKRGRVRVNCVDVYGDESTKSDWCEPCVPFASDDSGDFCIPEKNEGVWITFIDGDIDQPVYLGGWWSKNATPLGTNYSKADEQRIIVFGGTEIFISDKKCVLKNGKAIITLEDNKVTLGGTIEFDETSKIDNLSVKNLTVTSSLTANSITTDSLTSDGVTFNSHTHTDYNGRETSVPH